MARRCPLCSQPLPEAIDSDVLRARMYKLNERAVEREARRLRAEINREYIQRYKKKEALARREAEREAKARVRSEVTELKREASDARQQLQETEKRYQEQLRRAVEREVKKKTAAATRIAAREMESELKVLRAERDKERVRYQRDSERLQRKVDELLRKLKKQSSQTLGDEAEADLLSELTAKFPRDRIERVRKGAKGADIVHNVVDGMEEVGRIVYESKNVSTWQNTFITRAKAYQERYKTPYVVVVSRALPRKEKGLCVRKGIPVVQPGFAVPLACIIRDALVEIAKMRVSGEARKQKQQVLFDYILGDDFGGRFKRMAESVEELRELQEKERDWHDRNWDKQKDLHDQIKSGHRQIGTRINTITRGWSKGQRRRRVGVGA